MSKRTAVVFLAFFISCLLIASGLVSCASPSRQVPAVTAESAPGSQLVRSATISQIQGNDHRSPLEGEKVETRGVVVTASFEATEEEPGFFFLQDPEGDGDPATSDGLCVIQPAQPVGVAVGQPVIISGLVEEWQRRRNDLTLTCLRLESLALLDEASSDAAMAMPEVVALGEGGRPIPDLIADDDGLKRFEPGSDGVDFYEALEGMRVRLERAQVVGPTSHRGQAAVVADGGAAASVMHPRGGLLRRPGDANPEALVIDGAAVPVVDVGQTLDVVEGVLGYGWGIYRLHLQHTPAVSGQAPPRERTELRGDNRHLTVGSFNVLNLAATDAPDKVEALADVIVHGLGAPDLLALQEIQDNNGAVDDGTVSASETYAVLIDAVVRAGGPRYEVRQVDPGDRQDGGRPGANIRVGFLFAPNRVEAVDTEAVGSAMNARPRLERASDGAIRLVPSPGRLVDVSYVRDEARGWSGTRKPLIVQFRFQGRDFFVINLHWRSKGGDDRVFGDVQPPVRHSEVQRTAQAKALRALVDELLTVDPEAWIVVLGDLNEHLNRPPTEALEGALVNLMEQVPEAERYSYVFRGQSQILDHVLVSSAIAERAAPEIDIVHTASEYAAARQASDHEPIVVRLRFVN